jgi:hypothetical protein
MVSGAKVGVQVELEGADQVQKALNQIGRGAEVAGGKVVQAGEALSTSANVMTSSLGRVVSSVGSLTEGVGVLSAASRTAGASFTTMLGPIAAIGAAIFGVVQAVRAFNQTSEDMEGRVRALQSSAVEYTSVMERLADEGIRLNDVQFRRINQLIIESKSQSERVEMIIEGNGHLGRELELRQKAISAAEIELDLVRRKRKELRRSMVEDPTPILLRRSGQSYTKQLRELGFEEDRIILKRREAVAEYQRSLRKLEPLQQRALERRRQLAAETDAIVEAEGKSARERQRLAAEKAAQEQIAANQRMLALAKRFQSEALSIEATTVSQKIALVKREQADRQRAIAASIADNESLFKALTEAERAADAKIRAIRRANRMQRQAERAQEQAARKAAADQAFTDEQNRRQALIMMQTDGFERERQLIELRFQSAKRAAENEIQLKTALINKERELLMIQERQAAAQKQAEAERIAGIHQSIESMKQEIQIFLARNHALELGVNLTRQQALELIALNYTDMSKITDSLAMYSQGLLYASFAALQSGTSMKAAIGEALKAIALQAGVEAVMQTGRGLAALAEGPLGQVAAYKHFQAAAAFGGVAATAGVVGSRLAPSGGGGGGGGASPTGAAQSIRDRDFDRDEERGGVTINVNMGQAVIYDTKAAAERAFADRVVQAINTPRRGAVRLRGA